MKFLSNIIPLFAARQPSVLQGFLIIEVSRLFSKTPQSVGLLWTSDQSDAETRTWQHLTLTTERHSWRGGIRTRNPSKQAAADLRLSLVISYHVRLRLKCDGTRAETRFRPSVKRTSPFKLAGASVQSTTGRWAVHISLQGLYCSCKPVFCSHLTLTGYPLHGLVSPSLLLPCVTMCHHMSTGL